MKLTRSADGLVCKRRAMALRDAMDLLRGKWKFRILLALSTSEDLHFTKLLKHIAGISSKVLTRELRELEQNQMISRSLNKTKPLTVSYNLTRHAMYTQPVLDALIDFGLRHRNEITRAGL